MLNDRLSANKGSRQSIRNVIGLDREGRLLLIQPLLCSKKKDESRAKYEVNMRTIIVENEQMMIALTSNNTAKQTKIKYYIDISSCIV